MSSLKPLIANCDPKLVKANAALKNERAVYFTQVGGFDSHHDLTSTMTNNMPGIDCAIGKFKEEMKDQNRWDDVAVVTLSDFGRTLTSSGKGTDHAWGGNMIMTGGKVKGGQIHGGTPPLPPTAPHRYLDPPPNGRVPRRSHVQRSPECGSRAAHPHAGLGVALAWHRGVDGGGAG